MMLLPSWVYVVYSFLAGERASERARSRRSFARCLLCAASWAECPWQQKPLCHAIDRRRLGRNPKNRPTKWHHVSIKLALANGSSLNVRPPLKRARPPPISHERKERGDKTGRRIVVFTISAPLFFLSSMANARTYAYVEGH